MRNLALALLLALAPAIANADSYAVGMNQVVRLTLPAPARDVVIGNPAVADVTVTDRRHILLVGKTFGTTNLIVTGEDGRTLINRTVSVTMPPMAQVDRVTMISGSSVETYSCTPQCVSPGEAGQALGQMVGGMKTGMKQTGPSDITPSPNTP